MNNYRLILGKLKLLIQFGLCGFFCCCSIFKMLEMGGYEMFHTKFFKKLFTEGASELKRECFIYLFI